jgi:hypothetical protein
MMEFSDLKDTPNGRYGYRTGILPYTALEDIL